MMNGKSKCKRQIRGFFASLENDKAKAGVNTEILSLRTSLRAQNDGHGRVARDVVEGLRTNTGILPHHCVQGQNDKAG